MKIRFPSRRRMGYLGAAILVLVLFDGFRSPSRQVTSRGVVLAIDLYQATLSGRIGVRCRLHPSCSHYGEEALRRHGLFRGSALTLRRLARCAPWTPLNTVDPVPPPVRDRGSSS